MKKIVSLILSMSLLVGLAGCTSNPASKDGDLEKVTIVLDWVPNTNHTGLYVAQDQGYYEELGLDVEIMQPPEGGALSLVASNKAQFAISFQEEIGVALSSANPLPVTAVASIIDHNVSGVISAKEKNINSPKDLEGKRYASWDSPFEKAVLTQVMENDGGDYSKVNMIPNTVTDVITALKTDIDAVWVYYNWDGIAAELSDLEFNYFSFKDIDPVLDFYTPLIASGTEYLEKNPEQAKKFLEATTKGYEYAMEKPKEAAEILVAAVPEIDMELAVKSQEYLATQYQAEKPQWGTFDEARWNNFYAWFRENGLSGIDLTGKGFTNDYLPK